MGHSKEVQDSRNGSVFTESFMVNGELAKRKVPRGEDGCETDSMRRLECGDQGGAGRAASQARAALPPGNRVL